MGQKSQLLQTAERTHASTPNVIGEDQDPRALQKVKGLIDQLESRCTFDCRVGALSGAIGPIHHSQTLIAGRGAVGCAGHHERMYAVV